MLSIYRFLTFFLYPLFVILIFFRVLLRKEDPKRYKEKIFSSSFSFIRNKEKKLIWFHAASIGETLSIFPLIEQINSLNKNVEFLITTITLSSENLIKKKIKNIDNITHHFFPFDTEYLSDKFLNMCRPDLVCFVDSEVWPNFLFKIKEKNIPLALVNGRITKKTFNRWFLLPNFAKKVFSNFDLCLASSSESEKYLEKLQVKNLSYKGNLKFSVKIEENSLTKSNLEILKNFYVWCAASTHEGEELLALKTHLKIKNFKKNTLTIIIPRHIKRVYYIKDLSERFKLKSQILNDGDEIDPNIEILIINSFGVSFKYFNYCKNVFIGKSLIKKLDLVGGQNPIEAAKFGCKIYHGPYTYNFDDVYDFLKNNKISEQVSDELELASKIVKSFENSYATKHLNVDLLNNHGDKILNLSLTELNKLIEI
ncbi:hypothetical protein OAB59_00945 [Pelagibacteraceae bacterium]|nr:hypothetical protein [Pelagibacteraceae bacterium]